MRGWARRGRHAVADVERGSLGPVVTDDPREALTAAASGGRVVLILRPDAPATPAQAGRMAVLVGDPGDPAVRAAAAEMEAELYSRPR